MKHVTTGQKGLSLVEVLIAIAMIAALVFGVSTLMSNYTDAARQATRYKLRLASLRELAAKIDCTSTVRVGMANAACANQPVDLFDAYGNKILDRTGLRLGEETMTAICDAPTRTIRFAYTPLPGLKQTKEARNASVGLISSGLTGFCRNEVGSPHWTGYTKEIPMHADSAPAETVIARTWTKTVDSTSFNPQRLDFQPTAAFCTATAQGFTHGGDLDCNCNQALTTLGIGSVTITGTFSHTTHAASTVCAITLFVVGK